MEFCDRRTEVFYVEEVIDKLFHQRAVPLVSCRDDVAEQHEEGCEGIVEN